MTFAIYCNCYTPKNLKRMGRKSNLRGNFVRKLILSNAHCFIGLQFDHPDGALQKNLEQKKLRARLSLRAWNKTAILQWSQILSHPSEVGNVKGQHTGKKVCWLYNNYFQYFLLSQYKRLSLSLQNIHFKKW